MSKAIFTYQTSASKDQILSALIEHLTPKSPDENWGRVHLENAIELLTEAQQDRLKSTDSESFENDQLCFRIPYRDTTEMAELLKIHREIPTDYIPPKIPPAWAPYN